MIGKARTLIQQHDALGVAYNGRIAAITNMVQATLLAMRFQATCGFSLQIRCSIKYSVRRANAALGPCLMAFVDEWTPSFRRRNSGVRGVAPGWGLKPANEVAGEKLHQVLAKP